MILRILRSQRGGIPVLMVLAFMAFAVPITTSSLRLAGTIANDSRSKTQIMHRQYCALAAAEYLSYLLEDEQRWITWWQENLDPGDPSASTATESIDPCGETISITVTQQPVLPTDSYNDTFGDPDGEIPALPAYSNRRLQTTKTVQPANPSPGSVVTYTIQVVNRDSAQTELTKIHDLLPAGFSYDCDVVADSLQLPGGGDPVEVFPDGGSCPSGQEIVWSTPSNTTLESQEQATLIFDAVASSSNGYYCNEGWAEPGNKNTRSGMTAFVDINAASTVCAGSAVVVNKTVDSVQLNSTDTSGSTFVYSFTIDYAIAVQNIGTVDLNISRIRDLLPSGFSYLSMDLSGDITAAPTQIRTVQQVDRQRLTWDFIPNITVAAGQTKVLSFNSVATVARGNYWSDVLVTVEDPNFAEPAYSWPTSLISITDVYDVSVTDGSGNTILVSLQVWVGDESGIINRWTIR